ncbi:putative DNA polymerase alpha catalytic subunit [Zopfochytrium polystomum]|nr:putative DNA polymerase alpha catalytic subunit [Zopfochytrium polystomum]
MSSSRSSRRGGSAKEDQRRAVLDTLIRTRKQGESRLATYEVKEDDAIFDLVDEDDFNKIARKRFEEDNFVEDDDGRGYADNGMDDFGDGDEYSYESEAEEERPTGKGKAAKKSITKQKPVKREARVTTFLSNMAKNSKPAAAEHEVQRPTTKKEDKDFLAQLLGEVEAAEVDSPPLGPSLIAKPSKNVMNHQHARSHPPVKVFKSSVKTLRSHAPNEPVDVVMAEDLNLVDSFQDDNATMAAAESEAIHMPSETEGLDIICEDLTKGESPPAEGNAKVEEDLAAPALMDLTHKAKRVKHNLGRKFGALQDDFKDPVSKVEPPSSFVNDFQTEAGNVSTSEDAVKSANVGELFDEDRNVKMFWFDAFEKDGVVYLFGKVFRDVDKKFASCCLVVKNIMRNVFVLPRRKKLDGTKLSDNDVIMGDVYKEFVEVKKKFKISQFLSKQVTRKYAFELPGIPMESEYLKIAYPYTEPALPADLSGATFSHIFGTNTPALETFLLKRKLMGPCWLTISGADVNPRSIAWTRFELAVDNPKNVSPADGTDLPAPPMTIMSLSLRSVINHEKKSSEIVAASAMVFADVPIEGHEIQVIPKSFNVVRQLTNVPLPLGFEALAAEWRKSGKTLEVLKTEKALLNYLMAVIHRNDPDVIVGHNIIGIDLNLILNRLKANKVDNWSKIGRLRRSKWPRLQAGGGDNAFFERQLASGRILCDTFMASKEYVMKAKSYTLTNMAETQLNVVRDELDFEAIPKMFWEPNQLIWLMKHCERDSYLVSQLMFKLQILPLTKQLTNLAGNLWSRTIMAGSRADRNEFLLLHEFHNKKYVVPDKHSRSQRNVVSVQKDDDEDDVVDDKPTSSRRKPAYAGGLVLEPKVGFYDKFVLLLDFNSLYPSIIQEFNICFTTVLRSTEDDETAPEPPEPTVPEGVLPHLLATLVQRRRAVKGLMKDERLSAARRAELDICQQALKLTANSMYGCLGFVHSRFYAKPLAMLVTQKGREILQATVDLAMNEKLDVIYGDTDSIMIYTNSDTVADVLKIGNEFKRAVNKRYRLMEIEVDGIFKKMLLLKKKKYAALVYEEKGGKFSTHLEKKGLDIVRRDWCNLSHEVSEFVLNQIFSDASREDMLVHVHEFLTHVGENVKNGSTPIDKFVINKGLTKSPEEYPDAKNLPHVQVALTLKQKGVQVRAGDTVPYVIVVADTPGLGSRARHPDDLKVPSTELRIDYQYYLANQVLPPVIRLLSPIEGTDSGHIATCLGLDGSKFQSANASHEEAEEDLYTLQSTLSVEERFKDAEKMNVTCPSCATAFPFELIRLERSDDGVSVQSGFRCPNPDCRKDCDIDVLSEQVWDQMQRHVFRYMSDVFVCDEKTCAIRTRATGVFGNRCPKPGCKGALIREYTHKMLESQLLYYAHLFDADPVISKYKRSAQLDEIGFAAKNCQVIAKPILDMVTTMISRNARRFVDLGGLFDSLSLRI